MRRCAVIMAGGSGTRLWPLSRRDRPKQLLRILDGRSLIERTYERVRALFAAADVYVIALAEYLPALAAALPEMPAGNLIGEPQGRDTAAAIALAAAVLHRQDGETVMGLFPADHLVRPVERFAEAFTRGMDAAAAHAESLVTFGIRPKSAHTGLGYVRRGAAVSPGVWRAAGFIEKPEARRAAELVASGEYSWNSGMFAWRTSAILNALRSHLPRTAAAAEGIAAAHATAAFTETARREYAGLARISIDRAVMEKAADVLMCEMDLEWLDVGSWTALPAVVGADGSGNTVAARRARLVDSAGNIVVSEDEHLIALVGVKDLVVVHSGDATLICRREDAERIKDLVRELEVFEGTKDQGAE